VLFRSSNPKGWEKVELKKCTSKIGSGSTPRGGKETYLTEGIALIRSLNIYDNEFKYKNLAYISQEQADKLKNVIVESSDVLFNITGASVCRCSIVPDDVLPARVNQHVSILRPMKEKLSSYFLSHLLISENVKIKLLGVGSFGGAVMEAITKEQLEKIEVILPSIDLQNQFAERVAVIEEQKAIAQKSLEQSESLFNSLLQKAFKGELVWKTI
jgi:type I restriction enzyme S subunit